MSRPLITTNVYHVSRTELARILSVEFVRKYWWFAAPVPITGLGIMLFLNGPIQAMGMLMLLWPFSIPARSVLFSTKASRLFTGGCHVEATAEEVVFIGEYAPSGKRLRYIVAAGRIKETVRTGDILLLRLRTPELAPIKIDAFKSDADRESFLTLVGDMVQNRIFAAGIKDVGAD